MADREREALRQAREALQTIEDEGESHFYATITCAISAIDAALSAPQHSHEAPTALLRELVEASRSPHMDGTKVHPPGAVDAAVARIDAAWQAIWKWADAPLPQQPESGT
jgi:hypothetical protein